MVFLPFFYVYSLPREYCWLGLSDFINRMSTLPTAPLVSKEHKSTFNQQCFTLECLVLVRDYNFGLALLGQVIRESLPKKLYEDVPLLAKGKRAV